MTKSPNLATLDHNEWNDESPQDDSLLIVEDTVIPANLEDQLRAKKTAPNQVTVADSKIPSAGIGVWALAAIPRGTRFGPFQGRIISAFATTSDYAWVIRKNGRPHHCVDASEPGLSNWMRYVNCARHEGEQNLNAFQSGGEIYYKTIRPIAPYEELLIWYGDEFGRQLGIGAEGIDDLKELIFKCSACPYAFECPLYLERHKKFCRLLLSENKLKEIPADDKNGTNPKKNINQKFRCPDCHEYFVNNRILKKHIQSHPRSENICDTCRKRCSSKATLEIHQRIHASSKSCICLICNQQISNNKELNAHIAIHSNSTTVCLLCNKHYTRKYELNRHFKMVHSTFSRDRISCSYCNKHFAFSHHLKRHMMTHTGEKPFACSLCDKTFTQHGHLSRHIRRHNNARPYKCFECQKRFTESHHLKIHERIHTGEKPFECEVCKKRFSNKENMTIHLRGHSGETPYVCTTCGKRFSGRVTFKWHLRKHREEMPHACDCGERFMQKCDLMKHKKTHKGA